MQSYINANINSPDGMQLPMGTTVFVVGTTDAPTQQTYPCTGLMMLNGRLGVAVPPDFGLSVGLNLRIIAPGCQEWTGRALTPATPGGQIELTNPETNQEYGIQLVAGTNSFRKSARVLTRAQLCTLTNTFQGLWVPTIEYGTLPLFDLVIGWFRGSTSAADRKAVYDAHLGVGDNAIELAVSGQYAEPGQAYTNIPGRDFSQDLSALSDLIAEADSYGLATTLRLAGDGQGAGPYYNDPGGMTYGFDWLMANFARIYQGLESVKGSIRWCPGYDAIFYGWTPQQVTLFFQMVRSVDPMAVWMLEFSSGVCHLGNSKDDYLPGGGLYNCDVFASEFDVGTNGGHNDTLWQIAARLLGPSYVRPSDQPAGDDPGAPFGPHSPSFYLSDGSHRGPFYTLGQEDFLYYQVRGQATKQTIDAYRAYKRSVGYALVG
jgi:hypothetical protein